MTPDPTPVDPVPDAPKPAPPWSPELDHWIATLAGISRMIETLDKAERHAAQVWRLVAPDLIAIATDGNLAPDDVPPGVLPVVLKLRREARRVLTTDYRG